MSRKTLAQLASSALYIFIYADQKQGKTVLPLTLSQDWGKTDKPPEQRGSDVAYVTCEPHGVISCLDLGYAGIVVDVPDALAQLPRADPKTTKCKDMTNQMVQAINAMSTDPKIKVIVVDGLYTYAAKYVTARSKDGTDKGMGYDGWGEIKAGMHAIEDALAKAVERGKHGIMTSWKREPKYSQPKATLGSPAGEPTLEEPGRPLLPGEAKDWMPGQCDVVALLRSSIKKATEGAKIVDKFVGKLQVLPSEEYIAGSRWNMGGQFIDADLRPFLTAMRKYGK